MKETINERAKHKENILDFLKLIDQFNTESYQYDLVKKQNKIKKIYDVYKKIQDQLLEIYY